MSENEAKKIYYEPMHTCEHILNQTMIRMFGCERSKNAHIEKKKSKCDYFLPQPPTEAQIFELTRRVNEVIIYITLNYYTNKLLSLSHNFKSNIHYGTKSKTITQLHHRTNKGVH
jgi:Ser-tRNA(Ala) deacylase AlaX